MSRRRNVRRGLAVTFVVLAVAVAWIGWQAVHVRRDLAAVQGQVGQLRTQATQGDYAGARRTLATVRGEVRDAAGRTSDPVWSAAAAVPLLGRDLAAVRDGAAAADDLARTVLPDVERLTEMVEQRPPLQAGAVQLEALAALQPVASRAAAASARVRAQLTDAPQPFVPAVRTGLTQLGSQVAELDDGLRTAAKALSVLPQMLGAAGPRTYFLAVQNNAEARATGGLIGSFAIVRADHGRLTLTRTGSDTELRPAPHPVRLAPDAAETWEKEGSAQFWYNANLTPHFPDAATSIAGLWAAQTSQRLDGVLAIDPVAMSDLLRPTGPVTLAGGVRVGADDVVDFALHREYVLFPATDQTARKKVLSTLASAIFDHVVASPKPAATLRAVFTAAGSGHVLAWSRRADEQAVLSGGRVGDALPAAGTPFVEVLTQDYAGSKLDYYVRRQVTVSPVGPGLVRVEVQLHSVVPPGLPAYMTIRADHPMPPVPVGQEKLALSVYGAVDSRFDDVRLDGETGTMAFDTDHGHGFGTLVLELPPGATRTVSVVVSQPTGRLDYRQQPLAYPDQLSIGVPHRVIGR